MILRRDVQYFLRAYEFAAKIIYVFLLCKFYEGFFVRISVIYAADILQPMTRNVLEHGTESQFYVQAEGLVLGYWHWVSHLQKIFY